MKVRIKSTGEVINVTSIQTCVEKVNPIGQHILHYRNYNPEEVEIVEEKEKVDMSEKWAKAREYANFMHKKVEEFYGRKCSPSDIFYKKSDIAAAYVTGWEEAIEIVKKIPAEELDKFLKGE